LYYSAKVLITTLVLTVAVGALVQNAITKADGTESPARAVPHEALDQQTPASCYVHSSRAMPTQLPPLEYPDRFEVRLVSTNGGIRWNKGWVNVSSVCARAYVGLEEIDDGIWNVYFGPLKLGRLLERHMRIEDAYGRLKRHHNV